MKRLFKAPRADQQDAATNDPDIVPSTPNTVGNRNSNNVIWSPDVHAVAEPDFNAPMTTSIFDTRTPSIQAERAQIIQGHIAQFPDKSESPQPASIKPSAADRKEKAAQSQIALIFRRLDLGQKKIRHFAAIEDRASGLKQMAIETGPWLLLVCCILVAVIIIAVQPFKEPTYDTVSSRPLDMSCLAANLARDSPQEACLFVLSGSRSAVFQGYETGVMSHNGSDWLTEKALTVKCQAGKQVIGQNSVLTAAVAAALGKRIYVVGVASDGCFQSYDGSSEWQQETTLPADMRREGVSFVAYKNSLFVVGGYERKSQNLVDWVSVYTPQEMKGKGIWEAGAPLLTPRSGVATCVGFGRLFALGGSYSRIVESFDGERWRSEPSLHRRITGAAAVFFNDKIFSIGGFSYGSFERTVETYNGISWRHDQQLKVPRAWHACVIWQNRIMCLGGTSESSHTESSMSTQSSIEVFTPLESSFHGSSAWEINLINLTAPLNMLAAVVFSPQEPPPPRQRRL
mmetsp:Transcript_26854/g.39480  ORF Transcript_26854/g.39480 Transcript_26854/m.39480 type:complete len:514 (-) Transcript_26854:2786-4327(-)